MRRYSPGHGAHNVLLAPSSNPELRGRVTSCHQVGQKEIFDNDRLNVIKAEKMARE